MKSYEFITEKFNQSEADQTLSAAMVNIVRYWKTNLTKGVGTTPTSKNYAFRELSSTVTSQLYEPYMRKAFNDERTTYTSKEWEDLISSLPRQYPEYDVTSEWNASGHLEFSNVSEYNRNNKVKDSYKEKLYFTIDPKIPLSEIQGIVMKIVQYLADDNSGIMKFKINGQNDVNSEADTLCVYVEKGANGKQEYNNIKRIFPSVDRGHRGDMGHDHDSFVLNPFSDNKSAKETRTRESDSSVRLSRFAEFLINSYNYVNQLISKNSDEGAAGYLVNLWKAKFARAQVFDAPVPPIIVAPTPVVAVGEPTIGKTVKLMSGGTAALTAGISTDIGHRVLQSAPDSKFYSSLQFSLVKNPDSSWAIKPNPTATNQTFINSKPITSLTNLQNGMRITVGNAAKRVEKCPLIVSIQ